MGGKPPGPICVAKLGRNWVDGGTLCRSKSHPPGVTGSSDQSDSIGSGGEFAPLLVVEKPNCNVSIEFEARDLSVGKARFTGAEQISKNLASKPTIPGRPNDFIPHANVEVHLYDDCGNEVPMSRRLVRYWSVQADPNAVVEDLSQWRIVGVENSEFSPFGASSGGSPASRSFEWDRSSKEDAPGVQGSSADRSHFGQLQEFLVGNPIAGGAYYQIYTLEDATKIRVFSTTELKLSAKEFREALRLIDSGAYAKSMARKLFLMPRGGADSITPYPKAASPLQGSKRR